MVDLEKAKRVADVLFQYNDYETSKLIKDLVEEIERLQKDDQGIDEGPRYTGKPIC